MTPTMLATYLKVLRDGGAASAELVLGPSAQGGDAIVRIVFAPDAMPVPQGDELTPGGWKGPTGLDRDPLAEERNVP